MTTKSMFRRSTPSAFTLCSKIRALFPVSKRMRLPPYSTRAAKPQSMVIGEGLANASYRMVERFGVLAAAVPASSRATSVSARCKTCRFIGLSWRRAVLLLRYVQIRQRPLERLPRPGDRLGEGRMRVNRESDVRTIGAALHGERDFADQLAGVRAHDAPAQHAVAVRIEEQLREALLASEGQ